MFLFKTVLCFVVSIDLVLCVANLKYFETFSQLSVSSKVVRTARSYERRKNLKFQAFGRAFHLSLKSGTNVLSKDFEAVLFSGEMSASSFDVDQSQIYSGHLTDDPSVKVNAHTEETLWSINIFLKNDTYTIEPAWYLLNATENPYNNSYMVYRRSDLEFNAGQCGVENTEDDPHLNPESQSSVKGGNQTRLKRETAGDSCQLNIVADFSFFKNRCNQQPVTCTSIIIHLTESVDTIFRGSTFEGSSHNLYKDIGFRLKRLVLYTTPTVTSDKTFDHFNAKDVTWDASKKLQSFGYFMSQLGVDFCLNHLLTSYPMPDRVLGLAQVGQVCDFTRSNQPNRNIALSSSTEILTGPVTTLQFMIVITHGHNFGSRHDPATASCSQQEEAGGNFIMWDRAVDGLHSNNHIFSPCTLKAIGRHLEMGYGWCFVSKTAKPSLCGNGIVEEGEDCDAGAVGLINADPCCDKQCWFKDFAVCSDMNTVCCANCKMAPRSMTCFDSHGIDCKKLNYCSGNGYMCQEPENLPDWTPCNYGGQCYQGKCLNFCQTKAVKENLSLSSCMCRSPDNACKWCCFDNSDPRKPGPCTPYSSETLVDGLPCYKGYCEDGLCAPRSVTTTEWIQTIFTNHIKFTQVRFFKSNIVLCVVVLSLMLWVPLCCWICTLDNDKRFQKEIEELRLMKAMINKQPQNKKKVRAIPKKNDLIYRKVSIKALLEKKKIELDATDKVVAVIQPSVGTGNQSLTEDIEGHEEKPDDVEGELDGASVGQQSEDRTTGSLDKGIQRKSTDSIKHPKVVKFMINESKTDI
ncbi:ADAM 17-like protease [Physella acuta]|uniref:ADAM 17-like protease n=1 Tax=Physella acuta TaxID=109671 RepID=UPI0027DE67AF|nr:ADAM 17-like protease [Physella acuta]